MPESTSPDSRSPGRAGGRVGKYEIVRPIGKGAMGQVYLAHDTVLDRDVALKVVASHIADEAELRQRFEREARAVARLAHPNVVTVYDLGSDADGSPYIAMELLKGRDLRRAVRETQMPLERKVAVIVQVLAGLAAAHQAGVVHRDIKPANIFIQDDGSVKIMDFGVARLATASTTATGAIVGTADYMSPEQVKAARVDGRSDLFSVGCMLFELVCGRRPFHAEDLMSIFYKITHDEAELSLVPASPEHQALVPILRKALAKDADARYQSAYEFAVDLREWFSAHASTPASAGVVDTLLGPEAPTRVPLPATDAAAAGSPAAATAALAAPRTVAGSAVPERPAAAVARPAVARPRQQRPSAGRAAGRPGSSPWPWILTATALVVVGAGGWRLWPRGHTTAAAVALAPPVTQATPAAAVSAAPSIVAPTAYAPSATPASGIAAPPGPAPAAVRTAALLRAAQAAFKAGSYERAAAAAQSVLRDDAANATAQKLLDDALAGQKAAALLASADAALVRGEPAAAEAGLSDARRVAPWEPGLVAFSLRLAEAQRRSQQDGQARAQQARAAQLAAILDEGSTAMERRQFDAAVAAYNRALALDPGNVVAQTGKSNALTAKTVAEAASAAAAAAAPPAAATRAFVAGRTEAKGAGGSGGLVGFEDSPGVVVRKGTQSAELPGRIVFDASPASPRPGERFRIAVSLVNEGSQPIQLASMNVATTVDGRRQSGPVPPAVATVAPGARAVVWQTPGGMLWKEGTGSWSLEVALRTSKGETYRSSLSWR